MITCGDTEISAMNLRLTINKLSKVNEDGTTGFSIQFKVYYNYKFNVDFTDLLHTITMYIKKKKKVSSSVSSSDIPSDAEANLSSKTSRINYL